MVYPHSYRTEHSETRTTNSIYGDYYSQVQSKKIHIQPDLLKIIQYIDSHRENFLKDLTDFIAIKSVSGELEYKSEVDKMIDVVQEWFFKLGLKYERFNIGFHKLGGHKVRLPTIILASLGANPRKKTLFIYVHLDVKNPDLSQWLTDPWTVTEIDNYLHGCGVAQGKCNMVQWLHVIEAFQESKTEFPVNIKFIVESMYHYNSEGLEELLALRKHDFFSNTDHIVVCDSEWIGKNHPCVIYGTIGVIHFDLYVQKVEGSKTEPQDDLVNIFKEVVDPEENILIPHHDEIVTPITPLEEKMYEAIGGFHIKEIIDTLPPFKQNWDKVKLLMHTWRLPSIWIGETEECTCPEKDPTIFKKHFIYKTVPRQITKRTIDLTISHIENVVKKLNIENKVTCQSNTATRYWYENVASVNYQAARRATLQIYKEDPSMIREDRTRVNLTILDRVLESNIVLLPMFPKGSNAGGDNENIFTRVYYEGTKLLAAYLFQLAKPITS